MKTQAIMAELSAQGWQLSARQPPGSHKTFDCALGTGMKIRLAWHDGRDIAGRQLQNLQHRIRWKSAERDRRLGANMLAETTREYKTCRECGATDETKKFMVRLGKTTNICVECNLANLARARQARMDMHPEWHKAEEKDDMNTRPVDTVKFNIISEKEWDAYDGVTLTPEPVSKPENPAADNTLTIAEWLEGWEHGAFVSGDMVVVRYADECLLYTRTGIAKGSHKVSVAVLAFLAGNRRGVVYY